MTKQTIEFKEEDLIHWPHRDSYLIDPLNGIYTLHAAREDLQSFIDREKENDKSND